MEESKCENLLRERLTESSSSSSSSSSQSKCSFCCRCRRLAKERRARFYILRRCVLMLVCWQDS
ncbi:hypothetical protein AMTRI_Chr07g28730 [Amborella trichopoda]